MWGQYYVPSPPVLPPVILTSNASCFSLMGVFGLGVVVGGGVVGGGAGGRHRTPADSVDSQSCTPQESNLQHIHRRCPFVTLHLVRTPALRDVVLRAVAVDVVHPHPPGEVTELRAVRWPDRAAEAELPARDPRLALVPLVVADAAPFAVVEHLDVALHVRSPYLRGSRQ